MTNTDKLAAALATGDPKAQAVAIERLIAWSIMAATGRQVPEPHRMTSHSQTYR